MTFYTFFVSNVLKKIKLFYDLLVRMFMSRECEPRRTIADLIMDKIGEKKTEIDTQFTDNTEVFK